MYPITDNVQMLNKDQTGGQNENRNKLVFRRWNYNRRQSDRNKLPKPYHQWRSHNRQWWYQRRDA